MKVNIALVQLNQIKLDIEKAITVGLTACKAAKEKGADIVLFPEMWSIGYQPPFENAWDNPDETGHDTEINNWYALAVDTNSDYINAFKKCAKELQITIAITYLKKTGGKPQNTVAIIDFNGNNVIEYSKVHTCSFSMEKHLTAGNEFKVADLIIKDMPIKVGAMICFDREFPESARTLMLKGAELILVPNCCPIDENRKSQLSARAFENMTAIAMTNYAGDNLGHSMVFDGMAYDENGYSDMLVTELDNTETIEIATIDIDKLREYRNKEVWGNQYRKPEAYII